MTSDNLIDLLEPLASKDEQVRYVVGGTAEKYLVPEELLNAAHHFIERKLASSAVELSPSQAAALESLRLALEAVDLSPYSRANIGTLIESDDRWIAAREASNAAIAAFRS